MKRSVVLIIFGLFLLTLLGATEGGCDQKSSFDEQGKIMEDNQQRLIKAIPPPQLRTSLERKNIARRLERINQENMASYIYLISYGKVMAYYAVSGKVSSLNSYMTPMEQVVEEYTNYCIITEAPDQDGSYGKNVDGVFFFTTERVYVEWKGEYLWSDQPLKITQPPELIQVISDKPKSPQ